MNTNANEQPLPLWRRIGGAGLFTAMGLYLLLSPAPLTTSFSHLYLGAVAKSLFALCLLVIAVTHLLEYKFPGVEKRLKFISTLLCIAAFSWEVLSRFFS